MSRRNLVIACDGTWNEPHINNGKAVDTNVVKFLQAMKRLDGVQYRHYEKGVGTRPWELLPGGVYGYGLYKRVLGGYRFLCNRFRDAGVSRKDNRIFIIGFSRGSYTARRLAGLINHSGIPVNPDDTELGWEMYDNQDMVSPQHYKQEGRFFSSEIEMVGVWDTVKATNDRDFDDNLLPANVKAGYHAMAIDEKRNNFSILKWDQDPRALQVWFAGVHSDIGGGYKSPEQGLSDTALEWMIYRAFSHGLEFKQRYMDENVHPNYNQEPHNSFKGIWVPLGSHDRRVLAREWIHNSVEKKLQDDSGYDPSNFPANPRYWRPT